jgi:hypothetical protein
MFYFVIPTTRHTFTSRSSRESPDYVPVVPQMLQEFTTTGVDERLVVIFFAD